MNRAHRRLVGVACAVMVADVASKIFAVHALDRPFEIVGSLSLRLSYNPGVAFSLGQSLPTGLVLTITALICVGVAVAGWTDALHPPVAVGLVVGGAFGNLFDRLIGGSVVDMIHLTWWPTFNLADAAITVGAAGVVLSSLRRGFREPSADVSTSSRIVVQ